MYLHKKPNTYLQTTTWSTISSCTVGPELLPQDKPKPGADRLILETLTLPVFVMLYVKVALLPGCYKSSNDNNKNTK